MCGQPVASESYGYRAIGALVTNAPETTGLTLNDQRPVIGSTGGATAPSPVVMSAIDGTPVTIDPVGHVTGLAGSTLTFEKWTS